jgi:hypothetical protein
MATVMLMSSEVLERMESMMVKEASSGGQSIGAVAARPHRIGAFYSGRDAP